jgi:hypothetical protein
LNKLANLKNKTLTQKAPMPVLENKEKDQNPIKIESKNYLFF